MKTSGWLLGGAALIAALSGINAGAAGPDQLTVAIASDISTLDPTNDISIIGLKVSSNIFSAMTMIDVDGAVKPNLAESWEASKDAKVWTFKLNPKARFQDDTPVTADDVVWTLTKEKDDTKSPVRSYLTLVSSIERVDAETVRITLNAPFAAFDRHVSLLHIASKDAYARIGAEQYSKTPVGSGPYKVIRWIKDERIELEAVPNYWRGEPAIKKLTFRPVGSEASRFAALVAGDVDVAVGLPPSTLARLKGRPGLKIETAATNIIVYLGLNLSLPGLSDLKLRQAIDMAVDRQAIGASLLRGNGVPIGEMVAPVTFGYDGTLKPTARNVERARELVKESGYKGEPIPFQYPNDSITMGNEVAQAVAGYLKDVGVNVELQGMEYSAFSALWLQKKLPGMYMHAFGPSIMDADLALTILYASKTTRGYWSNPEVDDLTTQQRAQTDPAARKALIAKVWALGKESLPYVPLYNVVESYSMTDRLQWTPRPDGRLPFDSATFKAK